MIILRFGEIGIKSKPVRRAFTLKLIQNIKDALQRKGYTGYSVWTDTARVYVEGADEEEVLDLLTHIFGVTSISKAKVFSVKSLNEIVSIAKRVFTPLVRGKRYAVRVRRAGIHPFRSPDVERAVGALFTDIGKVDLTTPEVTLRIEIRDNRAFFFDKIVKGPGGLPIGTQGRVLCLISGGFDSGLASWYMMKRGTEVDFLFLNLGGPPHLVTAMEVAGFLKSEWGFGSNPRFYSIEGRLLVEELRNKVNPHYWNLILKRVLYEVAAKITKRLGLDAIVTGESLGQVSSQTLKNLVSLTKGIDVPVFRPLLGFDKEEIVNQCRKIGTFPISEGLVEYCQLVPRQPKTKATFESVKREREKLSGKLIDDLLESLKEEDIDALQREERIQGFEVDHVPEGAIVLDLRSSEEFREWHYKGAYNVSPEDIVEIVETLPSERPIVLYCQRGKESKVWAKWLITKGFRAFSFKEGAQALKRFVEESVKEEDVSRRGE